MSNVVAIVKSIVGQVIAVSPEGARRVLIEGDRLFVGEQVLTGLAGAVTLELADGRTLDLGRDTQWSADAPDSSTDLAAATAQAAPSVEELQQAIAAGLDPTTELEATAAGATAAGSGAAGGGHSFVMLDATAGSVDPTIGFPTGPIGFAIDDNRLDLGGLDNANNSSTTTPTRESGLTLTATPSITEAGGVIIYTATLGQPPLTDLTVTLSNGQVIVISAGQTTGSVSVTIPPNDTVYLDGSEISATITGTTGGAGLIITPDTTPAVTQITDTVDTTTVTLTANPSVTEGGVITYTATLTNPAQTPVTVTLSNGTTITIGAGQSTGTVDVQTPPNDVYNNGSSVSTTITGATGGNFENLVPNPNPAVTTITDSIDNTGLSLTATGTVAEGGQITYTATLTNPAGTPVTVTLSNGAVITIAAGQTEGSVSVAAPGDDVYIDAGSVGVTIDKVDGGNFENLVVSEVPAVTEVTDTLDTSTVTLTATPSVTEGGVVTYTASVTAPVTGSALVITLANGQQITIPVGQSTGSVEFVAPDNVHTTNPDLTNSITGTTGGNYEKLETTGNPLTTVTDGPDSTASTGLSLSATGSVDEGSQITYTATLSNPAGTAMTVTLSNGAVINIAAGATTGTVTVDAPSDDVYVDAGKVEVTIEGTDGGDFEKLAVDNTPAVTDVADTVDTSTVKLTADVGTIGEGGAITYTATVSSPVTGAPLVVNLANGQHITIPVGQTTGTVQFTAPDNVHTSNVDLTNSIESVTGGNFEKVEASGETSVTVTDGPDTEDTTGLSLTATSNVDEGGQIIYTATLTNPAGTAMTVTLSNGAVINIAAGATTGTVTVDAPSDDVYVDAGKVEVTIEGTDGGDFEKLDIDLSAAVTDVTDTVDTSTVKLTADVTTVGEGGVITYTVTVSSPVTGAPLVVKLANGQTITIPVDGTSGTAQFTAPNNVHTSNLDLTNSIESVTGGNFEKVEASGETSITVTDVPGAEDSTSVSLSASKSVEEGGQITYTATLTNKAGTDMTITLDNGAVIQIKAGDTQGSVLFDAPKDDVYVDAGKVEAVIESTTGGDFEALVVDSTPAVTDVTDTVDTSTVKLTADVTTVGEGGVITYTVTVSSPVTGAPLVVKLANGQTITIPVDGTSGTAQFTAPNNVHTSNLDLTNSIESVTGGNFEKVETSGETSITVTDVPGAEDSTSVSLSASKSVEEGGQITYTATLTNKAGTDMTITLDNGAVIQIKAGDTQGSVLFDAPKDDVYVDAGKVEAVIESTTGGDFEALVVDSTPAVTDVTDTVDTSTVKLTADVTTVGEGGVITYTVTVSSPVTGAPLVVKLANGQTITIPVDGTSGTAQFTAPNNVHTSNLDLTNSIESVTGGNFEKVETSGETSITVTDVPGAEDSTSVSLSASKSVEEGGQITYTATLTNKAGTDMTITLDNGAVIQIKAGDTQGSVLFDAPKDDVYVDAGKVEAVIESTTGGDFEKLDIDPSAAVTEVTDTVDTSTVKLTADVTTVGEGGVITYTVTVSSPVTGAPLVVKLANGQTITIPVDGTSGTAQFTAPNNVHTSNLDLTNSIESVTGGNFEKVETSGETSITVTDVPGAEDSTSVSLSASKSVEEGGQITYTATLTNKAGTDMTITLDNGAVIQIKAGDTEGSVLFDAPKDDVYVDAGKVEAVIESTTGGDFEALVVDSTPAVTDVTDTVDTSTVKLTADVTTVGEGGVITYTVTVSSPVTGAPLVVKLANGQTITIPVDGTSGTAQFTAPNNVHTSNLDLTNSIESVTGGNFEKIETSGETSITVTDVPGAEDSTSVSLSASKSVEEGGQITYTATLTNKAGTDMTITLDNGAVIQIKAGDTEGSVLFDAPKDDVYVDAGKVEATIESTTGGDFEALVVDSTPAVTDVTDTVDTSTVKLTADVTTVGEGGVITYTVTVSSPVTGAPLVVKLANGQTITIPVDGTSGTAQFTAPNNVHTSNLDLTNSIESVTGGNFEKVETSGETSITVTDVPGAEDTTSLKLTATPSVDEGGKITYTATLTNKAGTDMTISLDNGKSITIKAGDTSGTVTIDAPKDDVYLDAGKVDAAITGTTGGDFEKLAVDNTPAVTNVADTIDKSTVTLTADVSSVGEGGVITYTVTLSHPVTGSPLVINLTNGQSITIPVNGTSGSVEFTAPNNVHTSNLDLNNSIKDFTGGNYENLVAGGKTTITVTDGPGTQDTTGLKLTATPSVDEGGKITYTATLTNKAGTDMTISLDNGKSITIKAGDTSGTVTIDAPKDDVYIDAGNVGAKITGANGGDFENLAIDRSTAVTKVTDTIDTTTLKLTATPSVEEGGKITYTATLSNPAGTAVTVTLSNGKTITIAADKTTGSVTIDAPSDDVYLDAGDVGATITGATGGNFEKLDISDTPAVTHVTDTINTTTVGITGTTSAAEGENANYTLTLSNKADADVTITLRYTGTAKDGSDFTGVTTVTIAKGSSTGNFSVPILRDGVAEGAESFTVQITSATGGNFENLVVGSNGSVTTTIQSNEAPIAAGGTATGVEDNDLVLTWANFGITDADTPAANLGLTITKLPADGVLQYKDGNTWKTLTKADVDAGKVFSKADIDGGKLKFVPDLNESGINANTNGVGDQKSDYAQIQFKPTDGQGLGNESTLKVDITPVADAPNLTIGSNNVNSIGLVKETWNSLTGLGNNGNGITGDALKTVFDNSGNPNSSSMVTNAQTNGVTGGSGSKTSGLIYLEAGKTYSFSGVGDDSLLITIGGKNVASATWGAGGAISGSFKPTISGYYTLDIYHANQSGPGSFDVNLSVDGSTPVDLSNTNIPMYPSVNELTNAGVTVGELHGDNGEGYYQGYKLNEGAENGTVKLVGIATSLNDTDGSEKLSIKLGGIPEGSILSDGAGHTVTVGKTEVDVTGWNLNGLSLKPPAYYNGKFDISVTATATEKANNDSASTPGKITVTVHPDSYLPGNLTELNDTKNLGTENDIVVADVNGLHVTPGQDYNLAFIVDTSGSMETSGVNAAKKSLESVFKTLANSVSGAQSGTVNILLVDFSAQVNTTVSVNLADKYALETLQAALDKFRAGGGTNYEDAFKTTANWFQNLKESGSTGDNQTFFITDGQPNIYQTGEQPDPTFRGSNYTMDSVLADLKYTMGNVVSNQMLGSYNRISISKDGYLTAEYRTSLNGNWRSDSNASGELHAQGDGTYELSYASSSSWYVNSNTKESFLLLSKHTSVEAIGLNGAVNSNDLRPYDTDGKPQTNIDPSKLAEAILGHTEATKPGNDAVSGGDGHDILFGDLVSFDGIAGNGVEAMKAYVAGKLSMQLGDVDGRVLHQYITEHVSEFDVSRANDGADTLLGGDGNDILFGQGGDDYLDGGNGNDILLGGAGKDTLIGGAGNDTLLGGEGNDILIGGKGDDILTGGSGADTFVWKAGDTGKDVIKDFKPAEGDRLDLSDLLQGEKGSTIDNFLKITTVNGESTLQVSTEGKLNSTGGLANADVTIKLEGVNWANTTINSLVSGADPTIKIDHSNS